MAKRTCWTIDRFHCNEVKAILEAQQIFERPTNFGIENLYFQILYILAFDCNFTLKLFIML